MEAMQVSQMETWKWEEHLQCLRMIREGVKESQHIILFKNASMKNDAKKFLLVTKIKARARNRTLQNPPFKTISCTLLCKRNQFSPKTFIRIHFLRYFFKTNTSTTIRFLLWVFQELTQMSKLLSYFFSSDKESHVFCCKSL